MRGPQQQQQQQQQQINTTTPGAELNVIFKARVRTENRLNLYGGLTLVASK